MAKTKSVYVCSQCGADSPKWVGKCPACGAWNTYVEEIIRTEPAARRAAAAISRSDARPQLLRDITAHLGTPRYWRLRLGIGHPRSLNLNKSVVDFVLGKPSQSDQQLIDQAIDRSVDHLPILMRDGWEIATQQLHSADPAMQQAKAARKGSPEAKPTDSL